MSTSASIFSIQRPPEVDFLHCWAVVLGQIFRQIVPIRVMTLIKREEILVPVAQKRLSLISTLYVATKTSRIPHKAKRLFFGEIFCLEYPSRRSEKGNVYFANFIFSFRKLQIFMSQTTDFHFVSFRFVWFRFAKYSKPLFGYISFHIQGTLVE